MKEKYIPSQIEIDRAENMMTSDQQKDSEIRAKKWEQEQAPWVPKDDDIDENFEREPVTLEQKKDMDRRLTELGDAFEDSNINWHMDGAINISLMSGQYIGNHKDIDLSIEKDELAKLETQLLKKGFGFFLLRTEDKTKNKVVRRVGGADFADSDAEQMLIAAVDENGQIKRDESWNFIDIHIVKRNEEGQALGNSGVVIPDKWTRPYSVEFQGKQINLSHPGKVLYYKLYQGRGYDTTDIQRLIETGKVTEEDVADVEEVFENEFTANIERGRKIFEAVARQLTLEMSADQIFEVLLQQPEFKKSVEQTREPFQAFAKKIYESDDKSVDAMVNIAIDLFKVEEKNNQKREKLKRVRQSVDDAQKIKQIREELKK